MAPIKQKAQTGGSKYLHITEYYYYRIKPKN